MPLLSTAYFHSDHPSDTPDSHVKPENLSWYSDIGNWVVLLLTVYTACYSAWVWGIASDSSQDWFFANLAFVPVMLVGVVFAVRMARAPHVDPKTRRAWLLIGIAFAFWLIGDVLWTYLDGVGQLMFAGTVADLFYIGKFPFLIAGLLSFPATPFSVAEKRKFWIDSGIILLGLSVIAWNLTFSPALLASEAKPLQILVWVSQSLIHIIAMLAVFSILVRRPQSGSARVLGLFSAGLLLMAFAEHWWGYLTIDGDFRDAMWLYGVWMFAQTMIVVSPQVQFEILRRGVVSGIPGKFGASVREWIPILAAAMAFGVLVLAIFPLLMDEIGVLLLFLIPLAGMLILRQVMTLRENAELSAQQLIRQREARFAAMVQHSSDIISLYDEDLICRYQSESASTIVGIDPTDIVGTRFLSWVVPDDVEQVEQAVATVIHRPNESVRVTWRPALPDGRHQVLETVITNRLEDPHVRGLVMNSRDVTERTELEEQLTYQAYHDPLTGLPNRTHFFRRLERALDGAGPENLTSVLLFDLDHFKQVNDSLGHDAGDALLIALCKRIQESLRPADLLGRLGGDEFTVVLESLQRPENAIEIAERIFESFQEPLVFADQTMPITISIGVAATDGNDISASALVRQADLAMYQAKRTGRNRISLFEPWMEDQLEHLTRSADHDANDIPISDD